MTTTVGGTCGRPGAASPGSMTTASTWSATQFMLVTHHTDRPGTVGRIGLMLGEADVNIGAMHLARSGRARTRS